MHNYCPFLKAIIIKFMWIKRDTQKLVLPYFAWHLKYIPNLYELQRINTILEIITIHIYYWNNQYCFPPRWKTMWDCGILSGWLILTPLSHSVAFSSSCAPVNINSWLTHLISHARFRSHAISAESESAVQVLCARTQRRTILFFISCTHVYPSIISLLGRRIRMRARIICPAICCNK